MIDIGRLKIFSAILFSGVFTACSDKDSYYDYLCKSQAEPEMVDTEVFYKEAMNFWMARIDTLEEFSYKQNDTLRLFLDVQDAIRNNKYDSLRFENEIKRFVEYDSENTLLENPILFVGSSTVNLWKTACYFPGRNVMNRGFGGASIFRYWVGFIEISQNAGFCLFL